MSKVLGKRVLPGGNVVIKPSDGVVEPREIEGPKTPKYEIKSPGKRVPEEILFPDDASDVSFIVLEETKKLKSERVITAGSGIKFVDLGPNNKLIISVEDNNVNVNVEAESLGGGISLIAGVSGRQTKFKTFSGGGIIEVSSLTNSIVISAAPPVSFTQNITNSAFGGGINPILAISGNSEIQTRTFVGGGIIEVSAASDGRIIVSATQNVTLSSFGGGETLAIGVSANREIQLRTLTGTGIAEVTTVGNTVQISAARATIETSSLGGVSLGLAVSAGTGNRNELRILGLTGGGIIEVSSLTNSIVISAAQNITNSAFGGGINPILAISGNSEIQTRTFVGGGIVEVSAASDGRIIVSATQNVTLSSFGGGETLALGVSANREIQLRTLTGAGVAEVTTVGNTVQISAARATIETSSLGGVSLGLTVSAGTGNRNELRIRGLTGGGIIEVSSLTNSIVISAAPVSFTQNITNSAFGGGINPILAISGNSEIQTRTFVGGGIIEVSAASDGRIIVSATQNVTLSSFGGGETLAIGVSANREIQLRTLTGAGIAEVTTVGNTVQISAARATIETSSLGGVSLGLAVSAGTGNRNELRIRGLTGGGIIEVSALTNSIVISATRFDDRLIGYGSSNAVIVSAPLSSIRFITQSAVRMTITDNGYVGIGTTSPNGMLEIFDPNSENSTIQFTNSATGVSSLAGSIIGLLSGSTSLTIQNRSFSEINFDIGLENRLSIGYDNFSLRGDNFVNLGDAEVKKYILTGIVSADVSGVQRYLFLPGSSRMIVPPNSSWLFEIFVLGKERNGVEAGGYKYRGLIIRSSISADSVFFVGSPFEEIISESTGAYGWEASVTANTTHGSLDIYVLISGYSGDDVYWISYVNIMQISI